MSTEQQIQSFRDTYAALRKEIGKVIVGHETIVESTLIALFGGGHVLLEGVPGLGKTLLVRTVADGGESYYFCGHHRATFPALRAALLAALEEAR